METTTDFIKKHHKLTDENDLDPLMERIGDSKYVLLGEATHGTHEYYTWRAKISKRLIEEKGFNIIAVEGDWPDCYQINRWIKGYEGTEKPIKEVLKGFKRWPTWMWANWEIAAFAEWLRKHNKGLDNDEKTGFYGIDVYSLWESMELMVNYLEKEDPQTAELAKETVSCFEPYKARDSYASVFASAGVGCRDEVVKLLMEVREKAMRYNDEPEAGLSAEINALVMANAEKYYKAMSGFGDDSWNVRDKHMVEALNTIKDYHGEEAKVIVWEHNTHIGDARATDMARGGLVNVGQLVRDQHEEEGVVLVGFGSYKGSVIAGSHWGGEMKKMKMPEAINASLEHYLHKASAEDKLYILDESSELKEGFSERMGHRAIGVVYHPERERGNYVPTVLSKRYDAFIYIDETKALSPLNIKPDGDLIPETYPYGI